MITKEVIQQELNKLIGEKADSYGAQYSVYKLVKNFLLENGIVEAEKFTWSSNRQTINFMYKGYYLMWIEWKRKKGETHKRSYWLGGSYTDWNFKGFEVGFCGTEENSIESAITNINKQSYDRDVAREQKTQDYAEKFEKIKELFGLTKDETRWLLKDLEDDYYNYQAKLKED